MADESRRLSNISAARPEERRFACESTEVKTSPTPHDVTLGHLDVVTAVATVLVIDPRTAVDGIGAWSCP